jgi:hypothetical protein
MSALTVYQGLEERFRTVPGLQNIILGEPTALHNLPCLYTAFYRFERTQHGQITRNALLFCSSLNVAMARLCASRNATDNDG